MYHGNDRLINLAVGAVVAIAVLLIAASILPVACIAAVLPQLPPCETPVAEVAASHPLGQDWTNLRRLDFRLEFVGTASNNVEVAFVRDLDAFGDLASDPPGWPYGPDWDTMRLVARGVDVQDERFTVTATRVGTTILLR